jgi:hypothetical protein
MPMVLGCNNSASPLPQYQDSDCIYTIFVHQYLPRAGTIVVILPDVMVVWSLLSIV